MKRSTLLFVALALSILNGFSQPQTPFLSLSANGRYIQQGTDKPFFINACTALSLPSAYTDKEIADYLANRVAGKFNTIIVCAVYPEIQPTIADSAFINHDFLQPKAKFWDRVDWVVKQATSKGLIVTINPLWKQGSDELIKANGTEKCRKFGQWFAARYKNNPNVIYFLGGNEAPEPVRAELEELGKGIQEVYAGKAIVAYLGESGQSGKEAFPDAPWLTFNFTHAYSSTYQKQYPYSENYDNWKAFRKTPLMLAKGFYELGDARKYDDNGTSERWGNRYAIRRQAWWNLLSGGIGNVYGAEGICNKNAEGQNWNYCTEYGGSKDMATLKLFTDKAKWWKLQPDMDHNVLVGGYGTFMADDFAVCAVTEDKNTAIIYTPVEQALEVKLPDYGEHSRARWFDPVSGRYIPVDMRFPKKKKKATIFETPGINHSGSYDWVLILDGIRPRK
jgi:hypothetical protein